MDLQSNPVNEILHISFNQDSSCFACGTENGFRVYSTDPFQLTWSRDFSPGGGLGVVAMLFRTNLVAFAGGGKSPRYQPHKVVLWDDRQARTIAELSFRSTVKGVRLRRDLIVVVLTNKIYVYGFRSLGLLDTIETSGNTKGLCCLSTGPEKAVLVCPGMQQGRVLVVYYPRAFGELQAAVARERTLIVAAHEAPLSALTMDASGSLLATASDKGTIVRVFDTATGIRRQELRRGADRAEIHSLAFCPSGEFIVVSSDKGTIHIFAIGRPAPTALGQGGGNAKSSLQRLSRVLPSYFSSEWSLAQFRVHDYRCIAAFGPQPNTVVIVCANGCFYKARFDPVRGGEMVREEYAQFDDASTAAEAAVGQGKPGASRDSAVPVGGQRWRIEGNTEGEADAAQDPSGRHDVFAPPHRMEPAGDEIDAAHAPAHEGSDQDSADRLEAPCQPQRAESDSGGEAAAAAAQPPPAARPVSAACDEAEVEEAPAPSHGEASGGECPWVPEPNPQDEAAPNKTTLESALAEEPFGGGAGLSSTPADLDPFS